jgi:MOSC domain-containing protein YiiM
MQKKVGKVINLFISKKGFDHRTLKESISLTSEGVVEDKFYAKNIERSVLITSLDSYTLALKHNIKIPYGSLGENILIDYNPYKLPIGSKLEIGEVVLQISQNCTVCNHLSCIDKKLPKLLKNDRGIFARVLQEGTIKVDDQIHLL